MIQPLQTAFAVIASTLISVSAQDSAPAKVDIRMLAFSSAQQKKEAFAHDPLADATAAPVPAPIKTYLNHQFSTVVLKSRKIVFTTKIGLDSLTTPEDVISEVTLPQGVDSAILLFLPGKDKTSAQIMAIDDSKCAFPAGSFHATNLSPLPIKLMLEVKQFDFKPEQVHLRKTTRSHLDISLLCDPNAAMKTCNPGFVRSQRRARSTANLCFVASMRFQRNFS